MKTIELEIPNKTLALAKKNAKELGYGNVEDYLYVCATFTLEEFSLSTYNKHRLNKEHTKKAKEILERMTIKQ